MARKAFPDSMGDEEFEVTIWDTVPKVAYIRTKNSFVFAKIHEKPDPTRFVIHVRQKYIGYCTSLESAIKRSKSLIAAQVKCNYVESATGSQVENSVHLKGLGPWAEEEAESGS